MRAWCCVFTGWIPCSGTRVQGSGLGLRDPGIQVLVLGIRISGFWASGSGYPGFGFRDPNIRVLDFGIRVSGFRVSGSRYPGVGFRHPGISSWDPGIGFRDRCADRVASLVRSPFSSLARVVIPGFGFGVSDLWFRASSFGFPVSLLSLGNRDSGFGGCGIWEAGFGI